MSRKSKYNPAPTTEEKVMLFLVYCSINMAIALPIIILLNK